MGLCHINSYCCVQPLLADYTKSVGFNIILGKTVKIRHGDNPDVIREAADGNSILARS